METEQYNAEKPMGGQNNEGRNQKVPRIQSKMKIKSPRICGIQKRLC
jgi:hypothetical protein